MNGQNNGQMNGHIDMKMELVVFEVADVDRAKAFYENLGWRMDGDFVLSGNSRIVQMTPHHSDCSIIFGTGVRPDKPVQAHTFVLAVADINAARDELLARGVDVSEVFHYAGGPFNNSVENPRVAGRDPEERTYFTFVSFEDPDGNEWLVQEITTRLPGRLWESPQAQATQAQATDVATLAELLHETAEHHDTFDKANGEHNWWDWYAPYLSARQQGSSPDEAASAANRYMETLHVAAR
jgi:catechol 2,3-dioxygenase-like lactoylglutathione lyase family enzyme